MCGDLSEIEFGKSEVCWDIGRLEKIGLHLKTTSDVSCGVLGDVGEEKDLMQGWMRMGESEFV